jgi:hypothetical protein
MDPLRVLYTRSGAARLGRSRRPAAGAAAGAVGGGGSCSGCRAAAAGRAEAQHCSNRCVYAPAALVRMHPRTCGIHTLVVMHCREHLQPAARACDGEIPRRCCVARPSKCCWCRGYSTSHTKGTQCLPVRNCTTTFSLLCHAVLWCWHCGAIQGGAVAATGQQAEVSNTTTALFFEQVQPKTCLKRYWFQSWFTCTNSTLYIKQFTHRYTVDTIRLMQTVRPTLQGAAPAMRHDPYHPLFPRQLYYS